MANKEKIDFIKNWARKQKEYDTVVVKREYVDSYKNGIWLQKDINNFYIFLKNKLDKKNERNKKRIFNKIIET